MFLLRSALWRCCGKPFIFFHVTIYTCWAFLCSTIWGSLGCKEQWPMWSVRLALIIDHLVTCTLSVQSGMSIQRAFLGTFPVRLFMWGPKLVKQYRMCWKDPGARNWVLLHHKPCSWLTGRTFCGEVSWLNSPEWWLPDMWCGSRELEMWLV